MNWKQHIATLQDRGYTQQQIAAACGCAQASICDLASGRTKEPRYATGAGIMSLLDKQATVPDRRAPAATKHQAKGVYVRRRSSDEAEAA